jgi:hypothetical protein
MVELLKMEVAFDIIINNVDEHLADGQRDLEESRSDKDAMVTSYYISSTSKYFLTLYHS